MGKPSFGFDKIMNRRKSSGNVIDEPFNVSPGNTSPPDTSHSGGGFRVMSQVEVEKAKQDAAVKKQTEKSRFGRFSGLGAGKGRHHSFDDDSPDSSKRDSKSSSGTSMSRPYDNGSLTNRYGSTSTLPSSADTDPNDNLFSHMPPRPYIPHHNSSPHTFSLSNNKKALPMLPKSKTMEPSVPYNAPQHEDTYTNSSMGSSRTRAMTASSYASTAVAPKLDADLSFDTSFDDMFSGIDEKKRSSPEIVEPAQRSPGRSLLAEKRTFQPKPLEIKSNFDVEPPPKSWDSRGSDDRLITSPTEDNSPPPPPVPPHKYAQLPPSGPANRSSSSFEDEDAKFVRASLIARKSIGRESSPEHQPKSMSSSAPSLQTQTPFTSRSASNITTPKGHIRPAADLSDEDLDDNMFAPKEVERTPLKKPSVPMLKEDVPLSTAATATSKSGQRVMTAAEFRMQKQYQTTQPEDESSDDEYEDEEEAIAKREQEEIQRRKQQQLRMGRDIYRRSATAPADPERPSSVADVPSTGFPLEMSLENDGWDNEDIPLGVLKEHGFPSQARAPTRPSDATPSYFRNSVLPGSSGMPERPASAGALNGQNPRATTYRPPFARGLPADPFLGAGLVQQPNRESLGFRGGAASVHGGDAPTPGVPPGGLVGIIQMEENSKKMRRGGGASNAQGQGQIGGPFTYGGAMETMGATVNPLARNPQMAGNMNGMGGMNGMNGMNGMGANQMNPMMMQQAMMNPMMGMQMGMDPMMMNQYWQNMMAMQMQQMNPMGMGGMNMGQMGMMQNPQMSRMSQMPQMNQMNGMNNGMNGMGGMGTPTMDMMQQMQQQGGYLQPQPMPGRPMSIASSRMPQQQQQQQQPDPNSLNRPYSQFSLQLPHLNQPPNNGYTPSIAPSERSNIGMSSRYRSVTTNPQDGVSSVSSQTLQATGGAPPTPGSNGTIKGILKKNTPPPMLDPPKQQADDENWGSLAARRKKFGKKDNKQDNALKDLYVGLDGV